MQPEFKKKKKVPPTLYLFLKIVLQLLSHTHTLLKKVLASNSMQIFRDFHVAKWSYNPQYTHSSVKIS